MYNEQVLLGSLLGDGCLIIKKDQINPIYAEVHSLAQEDYMIWKNKTFGCTIRKYGYYDKRTKKTYHRCYIESKTNLVYTHYYSLFYPKGKKIVTSEILNLLKPLGMAVWFCDDGSYNYRNDYIELSTKGFSIKENQIICNYFKRKYGLNFKINKAGNIQLGVSDTKRFIHLIRDYVHELMHYKLGLDKDKRKNSKKRKSLSHMKYYKINRKKRLKQEKERYKKNRHKILKKVAIYRDKNREKINQRERLKDRRNKDKINANRRKRYREDKEYRQLRKKKSKEYYQGKVMQETLH